VLRNPAWISVSPDNTRVYVVNTVSGDVSVINTTTNTQTGVIPVNTAPQGVVVSPDNSRVYVAICYAGTISVINAATNTVISTINEGATPTAMAISPDGSRLYVTNHYLNTVSVINTATNQVLSTINIGHGNVIAIKPDGTRVYVSNFYNNSISVINTTTNTVINSINTGFGSPSGITFSPDGSKMFVALSGSGTLSSILIVNTATNSNGGYLYVTGSIAGLSVTPDGNRLYVPGNPAPLPVITASGTLSGLNTVYGTPSAPISFTVAGANMRTGILVSPPPGFEVSADGIHFSGTVTIGGVGTIAPATVYIRLAATTPVGTYSGNVVLTGEAAATINLAIPASMVTPAPLTITADNKIRFYGKPNPILTLTFTRFVNNDTPDSLTTRPTVSTIASLTSPIGQYPIIVSGASSPNYTITYVQGILNVIPQFVVPTVFTPNGDGINDTWVIKDLAPFPDCTVQVFTRWGQSIYTSIGYGIPWDGTYKGATLPAGTYYYIINVKNDEDTVLSGYVAIVR